MMAAAQHVKRGIVTLSEEFTLRMQAGMVKFWEHVDGVGARM